MTYALVTAGTVAASWVILAGAVGRPDALQQSHDAGFHVNALARVLATGDAGWFTVGATAAPGSTRTFYPSGLHALGALVAQFTGAHPVVVMNTLVLVLAATVWPVGMLTLLRTTSRDARAAVAVAALLPVTLVFPTLLLNFGVLWSNLAGLALAPALMALAVRACRPGYLRPRAVLALVVVVCGLGVGVVHPAALLSALLLVAPSSSAPCGPAPCAPSSGTPDGGAGCCRCSPSPPSGWSSVPRWWPGPRRCAP